MASNSSKADVVPHRDGGWKVVRSSDSTLGLTMEVLQERSLRASLVALQGRKIEATPGSSPRVSTLKNAFLQRMANKSK